MILVEHQEGSVGIGFEGEEGEELVDGELDKQCRVAEKDVFDVILIYGQRGGHQG